MSCSSPISASPTVNDTRAKRPLVPPTAHKCHRAFCSATISGRVMGDRGLFQQREVADLPEPAGERASAVSACRSEESATSRRDDTDAVLAQQCAYYRHVAADYLDQALDLPGGEETHRAAGRVRTGRQRAGTGLRPGFWLSHVPTGRFDSFWSLVAGGHPAPTSGPASTT
jgi:hypothetical protein